MVLFDSRKKKSLKENLQKKLISIKVRLAHMHKNVNFFFCMPINQYKKWYVTMRRGAFFFVLVACRAAYVPSCQRVNFFS